MSAEFPVSKFPAGWESLSAIEWELPKIKERILRELASISEVGGMSIEQDVLNTPFKLSAEQEKAVLSSSRYVRVVAGAGAGKTEVITRRIAYLLLAKGAHPSSIVAFTFTERAAASMKSRICRRVEQLAGPDSTANLGQMYVGTIHGYAKQVLDDHFGYGNYAVLDDNQEVAFLMRNGWTLGVQKFHHNYSKACQAFLRTVNMVENELLGRDELQEQAPSFYRTYSAYRKLLAKNRQLTFGTMISEAVSQLERRPETLSHVRHLVVDEYQDINQAQERLIELIGLGGEIYVVGDPRQSIYQWRGSNLGLFSRFQEKFADAETYILTENRRSGRRIVQVANAFAKSFTEMKVQPMRPSRDDDGFVGIREFEYREDEAKWIVDEIKRMTATGDLKLSDIGVLTRSVTTSAEPLLDELRRRRIPYIVGGKAGLFRRDEAQALGRIFAWFAPNGFWQENPWSYTRIKGEELLKSALCFWQDAQSHGTPASAESELRSIKDALSGKAYKNLSQIYQDVLVALGFYNLDPTDRADAAVMANLGRFNNLLTDYETANRFGGVQPKWETDLQDLCWFMNSYGLLAYEEQPSDDIRWVDAVQVMTIHQAKGLEWPVVFLFALTKSRFPPRAVGRPQNWCGIPRKLFDAARYEGSEEDERRLFYVAITRARDMLALSSFEKIQNRVGRSSFLEDIDSAAVNPIPGDLPLLAKPVEVGGNDLRTFSTTEVVAYRRCPYMYLLREGWGYQPGFVEEIDFGPALHYCLRVAGEIIRDEGLDPSSAVSQAVDQHFHMSFVSGSVLEKFKKAAADRLARFAEKFGEELRSIYEVEYRLEFPLGGVGDGSGASATVMGRVDVIMRDAGGFEVRDYKTSVDKLSVEEAEQQVRLYALGLESMGRRVVRGSIANLEGPSVMPVSLDSRLLSDAKEMAMAVVKRIASRDFRPSPGRACGRCDFKTICRWFRRAGREALNGS